jgi:hypothetical protein
VAEFSLEQRRAIALARARASIGQGQSSEPTDSTVFERRAALDAEERAAQEKLARDTQRLEAYDQSAIGKLLAAPSRLFGGESFAEEQLAKRKADAAEVAKRVNRERAFMEREGRVAPTPTFGERVAGGLKAIPRGAIEGTSQALGALGVFGSEGEQTARAAEERGTALAKSLGLGASETAEFDPLQRNIEAFGGGLGSVIPYLGAEAVGQRLKPLTKAAPYIARGAQAVLGSGQGASQARQQMDDFEKETGQKIDPTTRKLVQAGGGAIGLTELLPVGRMLDSLPGPVRTAVNKRITNIVTQTGAGKLVPEAARTAIRETLQAVESRAVGRIATRGALPEAMQEGGAQLAQNVLERAAYNPDQDVMENVAENAILGGLVGGTVRGGFEVTRALGKRAADNRQKAFDQTATPVEEFDINERSTEDPTQLTRQRVQRLTDPDDDGNVFARRADGTVYQASMAELYRMRVPTEGIRAVPIPETLSAPAVAQRLTAALGETSSDLDVSGFIKNVTTTLNNGMALGNPDSTEDYIQRQRNSLRRARISEEERIARMLVLDEAAKLNNEYMNLVTMPPEGTTPDATTAAPTSEAPVLTDEMIQAQVDSMREQAAQRAAALEEIAGDSNQIDKVSIFADRMAQNGLGAPTPVEVARLNDALRAESEAETAAGREGTAQERQRVLDRANIIESVLYDDRIPFKDEDKSKTKAERINTKMQEKGLGPLSRYELERIAGVDAANTVFGPEGEFTQRRDALLEQVLADPTITDKYRGFVEQLDQYPELGDPSPAEVRILRGDAASLEAQIPESGEPITSELLPAEPSGLPDEGTTVGQFEEAPSREKSKRNADAREAINELIRIEQAKLDEAERAAIGESGNPEAINERIRIEQAKLDAEPNKNTPAARRAINAIKALTAPYKSTPAARRAINAIKALEAERAALGEAPAVDEAPALQVAPITPTPTTSPQAAPAVAPQAAPVAAPASTQPASSEVALTPYQDVALSVMWYSGGSQTLVAGAETPSWVPDDVMVYDAVVGRSDITLATDEKPDVRVDRFKAKDGTVGTKVSVSVPSIDEKLGDRANTAAATIWLRNADPKDINSAIQTAEVVARWVASPKNSKAANGPITQLADQAIKFVAEQGGTRTPSPKVAAPQAAPAQPAPTAATQTVNNPEEDVTPVEEQLEADPNTIEGAFPAALNRPRAEAVGFAADMERRVKSMSSRFIRAINYKYQNAADYSQALAASYGLTQLPPNLNVARKFELLESRKVGGQMRLNRWYLQPIEDKIKELDLDPKDVGMYLWARSAPARNALVLERSGEINGSGMTDAQAQAQLAKLELEGLGPKLREVAKMHDALVDYVGNQRVKAGLLSRADWKAMRKAQPFYTPLKGYALNGDMQTDGDPDPHSAEERGIAESNGTRVREVLTARGRGSMPFNPLFNLMSDAQFAIARIEQNKVKEAFLNNVLSDPKSHEGLVTVYTPKKEVHAGGLTTRPKMGENGPVNMNQLAAQKNPTLMIVKKDGKPYYIEFKRTPAGNALYRAFANMTPTELGKFMRGAQEVSNTIKSFKTRYNPIYIGTTAWARDFNEAVVTAYAAQGIKGGPAAGTKLAKRTARYIASLSGMGTITDYLKGKDPTTAEGEMLTLLFDQFLEDGGAVGHAQVMDAERYAQDTAKAIKRYAAAKRGNPAAAALMAKDMTAKALDNASQLIDLQARFATYRAAVEQGINREDAAALALDSSLNLTRRGELAPYLDTWSFFFSPTVEGARKLLSQGRYSTIARKLFSKAVMVGALMYLFNRFGPGAGDDDEDGRPNILEVNNVTAQSRMIVRYGSGVNDYVAVPVAFGMGFFNYAGGQIMAAVLDDIPPEEAGFNIVSGFTNMASPIKTEGTEGLTSIVNFAIPDPAQPLWDLVVNRSAFGSKIYSDKSQYGTLPKSELGREETGEVWKFIARGMNSLAGGTDTVEKWTSMQPEQYRYIVQQYLGGAYGFGRDTVDLVAGEAKPDQMLVNRIPIIKSFFGKGGEFAPMNKFYEDYDELNALYAVYNNEEPDPEKQAENEAKFPMQTNPEVMDAFGDALSELRKINKDNRDGDYASREAMLADKNKVYEDFNRVYAKAKRGE